jgi:hypothetical protein
MISKATFQRKKVGEDKSNQASTSAKCIAVQRSTDDHRIQIIDRGEGEGRMKASIEHGGTETARMRRCKVQWEVEEWKNPGKA